MTEVAFHFNTPDKVNYICRLLRKAVANGSRVVVLGDGDQLNALDSALWAFSALDFVAHCRLPALPQVSSRSPIVLAETLDSVPFHDVLVNTGSRVPDGFERFERLIEVVSVDEEDRAHARRRWKHYSDRGYGMSRHDLAAKEVV